MKTITTVLISAAVALSINATAEVPMGASANYEKNNARTSKIVKQARGTISIVPVPSGKSCDNGLVVKLDYELEVLLKGKQKGNMGICVPTTMLAENFYADLSRAGHQGFGAFELHHKGFTSAKDLSGNTYARCDVVHAMKVNHNYDRGSSTDKAKVLWVDHDGSIKYISDLEISFKATPTVPVLGAVEIDISGVSNNGVSFKVGMDLVAR